MTHTPLSVAICLVLFCGMASGLRAQTSRPRLSSEGILFLFLVERTSVRNIDGGVIDLEAGTAVGPLSVNGDVITVTADGVNAFDLPKDKLMTRTDTGAQQAIDLFAAQKDLAVERQQLLIQQQVIQQQAAEQRARDLAEWQALEQEGRASAQRYAEEGAALRKEYLRLQMSRGDLREQAGQQARDELTAREQEEEARKSQGQESQAEIDAQMAHSRAQHRAFELELQVSKVRSDEMYEYNKAATEQGNRATYDVQEAADRKIRDLNGKINDARRAEGP